MANIRKSLKTLVLFVLAVAMIFTNMSIALPVVSAADDTSSETYVTEIKGANMTIGQDLSLNYYATLADEHEDATMHFVMSNGKEVDVKGVYDAKQGVYKFTLNAIPPQTMGDTIDATLKLGDEVLDEHIGYSVKAYAQSQFTKYPNEAELKQLLTDMLYYGEAAQLYRNYETDALVTNDVQGIGTPSGESILPTEGDMKFEEYPDTTARFTSAGVWFDYNNRLYIKFNTTEGVTVKVNGEAVTFDGAMYNTNGIYAVDFDKVYTFELYEGETLANRIEYSIKAYVYNTMNKKGEDGQLTNMAKLVRALYAYGKSAEAYKYRQFESKFTGDFLYRVGNQNTVSLGSLFAAKENVTIDDSTVEVKIELVAGNATGEVSTTETDWTEGTIQFTGTGVVKVTIQDYNYCKPTKLYLEVVDAVNATIATSATKNNVVLLQDCGFSSLEVSGGYTLFGNGFTMTCESDSVASDMGYSFVTLENGTLDNVQIVCPNFDYAALYKSNLTSDENRSETDTSGKTRYYNAKSGVMVSGNSQILNSRISGARAAVNVSGGNVVIDNSRIELGAVASILVGAANNLTLRDVTLVQKPTESTYKAEGAETGTTIMGFSVLLICNSDGDATPVTLEGTLVQNAWVDENDTQYVPSAGQSIIKTVLEKTEYLHDIDGDGTKESLNLGFAYMPESLTSKVNTTTITDNRTNKDAIPYDYAEVTILSGKTYVYSYKNTDGTADSFKTESEYTPNKYGDIITVSYSDTSDGLTTGKSYGTDGWVYELNVDLDKLSGYAVDFSKLSMSVNGVTVTDYKVDDKDKPTSPVTVTAGGTTYTLTATVNEKDYTATYKVTGTETSKESPSLVASNYEAGLCVASSYGGTWSGAAPALEGIQIRYWSVAEKQYKTITLSDYTPTTPGKQNGANTTWTYSPENGDFTLTLTGGQVHSGNSVYAMPVVCDGKLYFLPASSKGLVNTGNSARAIPVSYSFKDNNNGDVLTFSHTWSVEENKDEQYNYSDFCNGTLTKLEDNSGSGCVTPDTLVTLADGTQKRIDQVTYEDQLLVWDFVNGQYTVASSALIVNHGEDLQNVIALTFDDGTVVNVVTAHAFFDMNKNKFVLIDANNPHEFLGHSFVKYADGAYSTTKLVSYEILEKFTDSYSLVSTCHYNFIVENMFSLTNSVYALQAGLEIGTDMKYDETIMKADIEKYGLYTYADFADYISEEQFYAFNGAYLKISVCKGYITWEEILYLISIYIG